MRRAVLLSTLVTALAGCDAVTEQIIEANIVNEPTIVISAGYEIDVAGRPVAIQGFDECPAQEGSLTPLFRVDHTPSEPSCVVLYKGRAKVPVLLALDRGVVREEWDIVRDTATTRGGIVYPRTFLRRPSGEFVVSARARS